MLKKKDDVKRLYSPYCTSYSKPRPKHTSLSKANLAAVLQLKALNSFFSYVCDPLHKKKKKNLLLFFYKNVQERIPARRRKMPFRLLFAYRDQSMVFTAEPSAASRMPAASNFGREPPETATVNGFDWSDAAAAAATADASDAESSGLAAKERTSFARSVSHDASGAAVDMATDAKRNKSNRG